MDYDQVGTDNQEFIEIYNPCSTAQSLSNVAIMLVDGMDGTVYATIDLSPAAALAGGGYLVIAGPLVTAAPPAIKLDPGWSTNQIQNGAPDGIALADSTAHVLIDALSYEGAITAAQLTGFPSTVSLVEGQMLAVADSNTVVGSLSRLPNGQDTDNASEDWRFTSAFTPGSPNN